MSNPTRVTLLTMLKITETQVKKDPLHEQNHMMLGEPKTERKDIKGNSTKTDTLDAGRKTERLRATRKTVTARVITKELRKYQKNCKKVKTQPNRMKRKAIRPGQNTGPTQRFEGRRSIRKG